MKKSKDNLNQEIAKSNMPQGKYDNIQDCNSAGELKELSQLEVGFQVDGYS